MSQNLLLVIGAGFLLLLAASGGVWWLTRSQTAARWRVRYLLGEFLRRRHQLEADFHNCVAKSGKPRGLVWLAVDWQPEVTLAWDRHLRCYTALVEIAVQFAARPGEEMEGVEAVGLAKSATARFIWSGTDWRPTPRVLFNLTPREVLARFAAELVAVSVPRQH
jgi:hypothetical protein